jgi:hypothetical protein
MGMEIENIKTEATKEHKFLFQLIIVIIKAGKRILSF